MAISSLPPNAQVSSVTASALTPPTPRPAVSPQQEGQGAERTQAIDVVTTTTPDITANKQPEALSSPLLANKEKIQKALEEVQTAIQKVASQLQFSIDEDTGRTIIKVVDMETDEVIRQVPSEELLRISKALDKFKGLFLQQEV